MATEKLKGEVAARVAKLLASYDDRGFTGSDWDRMSDCEGRVFQIQPERLADMVIAWDCFLAFLGLQVPAGYSDEALAEARAALPPLADAVVDLQPFTTFAKEICGLTNREAHAIFHKMDFWQVRSGLMRYGDEPEP